MSVSTSIFDAALTTIALIKNYLGGDEKLNLEPVHNTDYNIDADHWNKLISGVAEIAEAIKFSVTLTPTTPASYPYAASYGELVLVEITEEKVITLPAATASDVGKTIVVKNLSTSSYDVVIDASGTDTIDGEADVTLQSACDAITLVCVAAGVWAILNRYVVTPE